MKAFVVQAKKSAEELSAPFVEPYEVTLILDLVDARKLVAHLSEVIEIEMTAP